MANRNTIMWAALMDRLRMAEKNAQHPNEGLRYGWTEEAAEIREMMRELGHQIAKEQILIDRDCDGFTDRDPCGIR